MNTEFCDWLDTKPNIDSGVRISQLNSVYNTVVISIDTNNQLITERQGLMDSQVWIKTMFLADKTSWQYCVARQWLWTQMLP